MPVVVPRTQTVMAPPPDFPEPFSVLFSHYLRVIWRQAWKIVLFVLAATALAYFVSKRMAPVYESTAAIDIDRQAPSGVTGKAPQQVTAGDAEQFIATQVLLIQSGAVLRPVVERYHLTADKMAANSSRFLEAKGGINIPGLKVVHVPGTYLILVTYRSSSPENAAAIANAVAESYIRRDFEMRISSMAASSKFMGRQIEELRAKMERSGAALVNMGQRLNFVDTEEKTNILTRRLLQLNAEYTNAQIERVKRQDAWNAVKGGSLETAQTSEQGEKMRKLAAKLEEAQQKFTRVQAVYGKRHPEYVRAETDVALIRQTLAKSGNNTLKRVTGEYEDALNRERMLKSNVDSLRAEVEALSSRSTQYQSKQREAESDRKLYEDLMQKIREGNVNAGFHNNSVRVADPAQPVYRAVSPNMRNNVLLALMLSLFFSLGAVILSDVMDSTVRDPEAITRLLNTEVIGMLPLVKDWKGRRHVAAHGDEGDGSALPFTGASAPATGEYDEALRSLRNSILLSGAGDRPHSLLFTSAAPAEGKTTTAVHIAIAHALQGNRTLLVDADLRRPGTQQILGYPAGSGLSDLIENSAPWQSALTRVEGIPALDILPAGKPVAYAADLIERDLAAILNSAKDQYDLIVIDAPPMLGFSEPLQLAALVDRVVIITLVGQTNRKSVAVMLKILHRLRARVSGVVLNGVTRELSNRYTYSGTYDAYQKHYGTPRIA
ncbi:MAG: AAA family ATPase [Acidobacteriota bacterium]|nr:AAA family ATPase [Acidobacteriota bacterium]